MTMAAAMESPAGTQAWPEASRIVGVEIVSDIGEAETVWRGLEQPDQLSTPYQRFDFLRAWQRQVGTREGLLPFIVIAYDAEHQPLLLLPLGVKRETGARVARFLGGKHATFNMALCDKDFAAAATEADLDALLSMLRAHGKADVLALTQQPRRWMDLQNPFALLPSQTSANDCPLLTMAPGEPPASRISNSFRSRLKGKERKLQSLPGYRYCLATIGRRHQAAARLVLHDQAAADGGAETAQRVRRSRRRGFHPRAPARRRLAGGGHAIDIHALECDDEVIAIFAGVADGQPLLDDVQHLHDVGQCANTAPA